jgi:glycosyltransferase involved in cell wall biosynthesis
MDTKALVSIIVPVYNVEKYLSECVESLIVQTYKKIEIILVDDGATDSSGTICDYFVTQDNRVQVIHKLNGGLSDARNTGLAKANGEYVYFCDSDDYIDEDTIEILLKNIEDNQSDCVFFNATAFADDGLNCNANSYNRYGKYDLLSTGCEQALKQFMLDEFKPCAVLVFLRKKFLDQYKLHFYKGIIGEDELFSFYVYLNSEKMSYCSRQFYHRRVRPNSIMTTNGNGERRFESYKTIYQEMRKTSLSENKIRVYNEFIVRLTKSLLLAYRNMDKNLKDKNIKYINEIKKDIIKHKGFGDYSLIVRLYCWKLGIIFSGIRKYARRILYV